MFGHNDEHDQDDKQASTAPMSTQPADESLLGIGDDSGLTPSAPTVAPINDDHEGAAPQPSATISPAANDDLIAIKKQALEELSPLVDHLDQSPEERFRTTMMMIQATDNHQLVNHAYDAAKQIKDDKARAQALLDIINEINYFIQK